MIGTTFWMEYGKYCNAYVVFMLCIINIYLNITYLMKMAVPPKDNEVSEISNMVHTSSNLI